MKISYLITVHNETSSLKECISNLLDHKDPEDEILILDDYSDNPVTKDLLKKWETNENISNLKIIQHALNRNYSEHKNFGNSKCNGDWICQIDGDEIPNPILIINLKSIIEANPDIELIFVPRINDFIGVTEEHAKIWGWRLNPSSIIIRESTMDTNSREYLFLKENGYILEESPV